MTAFKIQNVTRSKRVGIVANSLAELRKKGCNKLKIAEKSCHICLESDGTEVDDEDYFETLPANTVFVFLNRSESWNGYSSLLQDVFDKVLLLADRNEVASQIRDFISEVDSGEKYHLMSEFVGKLESNIEAETREEDPAWFEDVDNRFKNKEQYLKYSAQGRVRKYLAGAKEYFEKEGSNKTKGKLIKLQRAFQEELKANDFHGNYFVRSAEDECLCDDDGWFTCQGSYDVEDCSSAHTINPYSTKEARILFSTWNLDHVIEKSREVFPSIMIAVENIPKGKDLNWLYFYQLLFTTKNLKLVHIACHKKETHSGYQCDTNRFYKKV
ncbi:DNA fragmentation factor subunit beta-like [Ptychodera flava]|uniref:DNA fragmentation factor subunit beta-like n=1 Tax=Ptychodera flava TaxID=63121 RepID=UPI003969C5D0